MSIMLKEKRATRGKRMTALIGKAAEEDDAFWGTNDTIWDAEDESFSEDNKDEPDEFDSDFNDTEDDNDDDESSVDEKKYKEKKTSNNLRYKEPITNNNNNNSTTNNNNNHIIKKKPIYNNPIILINDRKIRKSTVEKSLSADLLRKERDVSLLLNKKEKRPIIKHKYTQKELLLEALDTELDNQKWLDSQKFDNNNIDNHINNNQNNNNNMNSNNYIKYHSRRGSLDTITFSNVEDIPLILKLNNNNLPIKKAKICTITGLNAKYYDPLTKQPYATIEAFKELRRKYN